MVDPQSVSKQVEPPSAEPEHKVIKRWSIWVIALGLPALFVVAWLLLDRMYGAGTPADRNRLEILKLAGGITVGAGGIITLALATLRQRSTELSLKHTEHDAIERRATELYATAAEQIASGSAAVRLAGLYSLERLGQANNAYRQTVVNVLCAYLRMPFEDAFREEEFTSRELETDDQVRQRDSDGAARIRLERRQELEVRLTAQTIIQSHLNPGPKGEPALRTFWAGMNLDLSGAELDNLDLSGCFAGDVCFNSAAFLGTVSLTGAQFRNASFRDAKFGGRTFFQNATFEADASFQSADFCDESWMDGATFGHARFEHTTFHKTASYGGTQFNQETRFEGSIFLDRALFDEAIFQGTAWFEGAAFEKEFSFEGAYFNGEARFDDLAFAYRPQFKHARARCDIERSHDAWPPGWQVIEPPSPKDGRLKELDGIWGSVTQEEDVSEA